MKLNKNILAKIKEINPLIYAKANKGNLNLRKLETIEKFIISYYADVNSICTSAENRPIFALLGQVYK